MKIARREVMIGLAGFSLAAILDNPWLARAAAASLETVSLTTASGLNVRAALAVPTKTPAPAVMLIHEWWGLNDQIKAVAAELGMAGYLALAVDLYGGRVAADPDDAKRLVGAVEATAATDVVKSWAAWLKSESRGNGKLATIGWCFGGGWSLNASLAEPADATVIYYGDVAKKAAELTSLKGPVLGHFASKDQRINQPMVDGFAAEMKSAGKSLDVHWYDADHAFANPTGARYDEPDAKLAWERTLAFFKATIG